LTFKKPYAKIPATTKQAGVVQLVERLLAKEKVVGSSPIARSLPADTR
jgi:hypothetical protein